MVASVFDTLRRGLCLCVAIAWFSVSALGQDPAPPADADNAVEAESEPAQAYLRGSAQPAVPAAAIVNGEPITVKEVEAAFAQVPQGQALNQQEARKLQAKILKAYVDNRLVAQWLDQDDTLVNDAEVEKQMNKLREEIKKQGKTLEEVVAAQNLTLEAFRKNFVFQIGWSRYLERNLTDAVEKYFNTHKAEFDGTELRVSHIVLRPDRFNETVSQLEARAAEIREEIVSGKLSFADAAKKYSLGPSAKKGGDLGFIPRHNVMLDDFGKAAFALKQGEISPPVTTPFGTHLITVTDSKPGNKQWTQVIPQIRAKASQDMIEQRADELRKAAEIEYTGLTPYYKPGSTSEVVVGTPATIP